MGLKDQKYFCNKCLGLRSPLLELVDDPNSTVKVEKEVIKSIKHSKDGKEAIFTGRQLECKHFIPLYIHAFSDLTSDNLSDVETSIIRRYIDKSMINKTNAEIEQLILFHCEQYQTLLKIASKQKQQSKYAIQYLDQLREKFASQLTNEEEKQKFEMRFAMFGDLRPTSAKVIERERTKIDREADKQKAALDKIHAILKGTGIKTRFDEGFKKTST